MEGITETADEKLLQDLPKTLPLLPLRDLVVFPLMVVPLNVQRRLSASALEEAMSGSRLVIVVSQKEAAKEHPTPSDLYYFGTVCTIIRLQEKDENGCQLLLQGLIKAKIESFYLKDEHYLAEYTPLLDPKISEPVSVEHEALRRTVLSNMERLIYHLGVEKTEALMVIKEIKDPGKLADLTAAHLGLTVAQAQELLEKEDSWERLALVNNLLSRELAVLSAQDEIKQQTADAIKKSQRHFYLEQQLACIKAELGQGEGDEYEEWQQRINDLLLPEDVRREATKELSILRQCGRQSPESSVIINYLNTLLDFPWFVSSRDNLDINHARSVFAAKHAYLDEAKERILEHLAVSQLLQNNNGAILCFVGPPGVGKTSLAYSVGEAMGRRVMRIALGGVNDEAEIRGHRRSYVGARPGRIVQAIAQSGTANPLIILDEIDKMSEGLNGSPEAALLEVLDKEQNNSFTDHYLNVAVDLSQIVFVATANRVDSLPPALKDRLEVIYLSGYSLKEKLQIAQRFIVPKELAASGLTKNELHFSSPVLERLILDYTREAGCRELGRRISAVCRHYALKIAEHTRITKHITVERLANILGPIKYRYEDKNEQGRVGVVNALAWTPVGGEILHIEAIAMKGHPGLILTGQMGDIMKESARIALSYVRSNVSKIGISSKFFDEHEIHIHVPAAAIPKDGPSAGLAMALALASLASGRQVRDGLAVTGEISLSGQVLAVGGLKEKLLAAQRYHISQVFYPAENYSEVNRLALTDIPGLKLVEFNDLLGAICGGLV